MHTVGESDAYLGITENAEFTTANLLQNALNYLRWLFLLRVAQIYKARKEPQPIGHRSNLHTRKD